MVYLTIPS